MSSAGIYARCRSRCLQHRTPPAARSPSSDPACCSDSLRSLLPRRSSLLLYPDRHPRRPRAPPQPPYGLSPSREKPRSAGRTGTAAAPAGDGSASLSHGCAAAAPAPGGSVRGAALTGSRSRSGPRPARRGSGEREGQGRGSEERASCGEQPQLCPSRLSRAPSAVPPQPYPSRLSRAASAVPEPPQPCPAPPRGPSGCRWLHRAAARPEPRGFPRFPARPPRISPDGLQRQRGKPPVPSVSQRGNLPAPAAQSPSHSACPGSAAALRNYRAVCKKAQERKPSILLTFCASLRD